MGRSRGEPSLLLTVFGGETYSGGLIHEYKIAA
jgi:hypothetical protein